MTTFTSNGSHPPNKELPLKLIPGSYGFSFFGPLKDRLDYFYFQGQDDFFHNRMRKFHSTIFRTNMPPGPFISSDSKVVVLLDAVSFPILFDNSKVEKRNVLDGTYMPSTALTGGYRVCAFLDPSEPNHGALKSFFLSFLASKKQIFIPLFRNCLSELFTNLEDQLSRKKEAQFNSLSDNMSLRFMFELLCDEKPPSDTKLSSDGAALFDKWLFIQLAPLTTLGLPKFFSLFEDLLLHTVPLPSFLVKPAYNKLYKAFYTSAASLLDEAERWGINREEACHNLVFIAGFNAYGGMKVLFPTLIKWVGLAGEVLHRQLADEIRTVVKEEGGVTLASLEKMSLTKSVVYEALRIEPPVPFQYGKAKDDLVVQNHDAKFVIKKGEMIFGYQPFATKDPMVFEKPEEFVGHRFVGKGQRLLKYVYWSNGRETESPSWDDKQCPGKDLVVLVSRLMLVELFLRYDTFTVEVGKLPFGSSVTIKSLTKATTTV
ncbi:allene oxide synthase 3 [Ziziphus jujuba]|uniref:Allene oxide synthase 3 n=1 Tax=Ziziphus jujuba TaxID=326968 RepID=A0A6P4AXS1_ZIZJJ|nr:allene oxide synthase 3 [Ziziphus jujuba]